MGRLLKQEIVIVTEISPDSHLAVAATNSLKGLHKAKGNVATVNSVDRS